MNPAFSQAESPYFCGDCAVYESYCLGPDGVIDSDTDCPAQPLGAPGTQTEIVACSFVVDDATVEGTCAWSKLAQYPSDDCGGDMMHDGEGCEITDADGLTVEGICELGGCVGGSEPELAAGCQAFGASQFAFLALLVALFPRRRQA